MHRIFWSTLGAMRWIAYQPNGVLTSGGVLRLAVPAYAACARLYIGWKLANGILDILGLTVGGQRDQYDYHKMAFDQPSLEARLKADWLSRYPVVQLARYRACAHR